MSGVELFKAVKRQDINGVNAALNNGANIDFVINKERPLDYAINNHKDNIIASVLIENGANVNAYNDDSIAPLTAAILKGDYDLAKKLIEYGANMDRGETALNTEYKTEMPSKFGYHTSPLFLVIWNRNYEFAKYMISKGANVDVAGYPSTRALQLVLFGGNFDFAAILIKNGDNVNEVYDNEQTLLQNAVLNNNINLVKFLVKNGANINLGTFNQHEGTGYNVPLMIAIKEQRYDIVEFLINSGAKMDVDPYSDMPLITYSILNSTDDITKVIIDRSSCLNGHKGNQWMTPLVAALDAMNDNVAEYLLKKGANPNTQSDYQNEMVYPLTIALEHENLHMVRQLLRNGADIGMIGDNQTLYRDAQMYDDPEIAPFIKPKLDPQMLYKYIKDDMVNLFALTVEKLSIDVKTYSKGELTMLKQAVINGSEKITLYLTNKRRGVDVNMKDGDGQTSLHLAVINRKPEILRILVKIKTAMIDSRDNSDRTALHYAVFENDIESTKILIDHHANTMIKDNNGQTPQDLSRGIIRFILTGSNPENILRYTCFGIEIECCRPDKFNIDLPRHATYPKLEDDANAHSPFYVTYLEDKSMTDIWKIMQDGSIQCIDNYIDNPGEFVSPKLYLGNRTKEFMDTTLESIKNLKPNESYMKILKNDLDSDNYYEGLVHVLIQYIFLLSLGAHNIHDVNDSCGLHVHLSNQIFDVDVNRGKAGIDLFLKVWYAFEPIICLFVDPQRLLNQYCNTLRKLGSYERVNLQDKYQAVNIRYATDKTPTHIEIRLHHATTDKEEIYNWICLLVLLFSKCLYYSNNRTEYDSKIKDQVDFYARGGERPMDTFMGSFDFFFNEFIQYDRLKQYYFNSVLGRTREQNNLYRDWLNSVIDFRETADVSNIVPKQYTATRESKVNMHPVSLFKYIGRHTYDNLEYNALQMINKDDRIKLDQYADQIKSFLRLCFPNIHEPIELYNDADVAGDNNVNAVWIIAKKVNKIKAVLKTSYTTFGNHDGIWIERVCRDRSDDETKGVGKKLMLYALEQIYIIYPETIPIYLYAGHPHEVTVPFYEALGFKETGNLSSQQKNPEMTRNNDTINDIKNLNNELFRRSIFGGGTKARMNRPDRIQYDPKIGFYKVTPFGNCPITGDIINRFADKIKLELKQTDLTPLFKFLTEYGYIHPGYLKESSCREYERTSEDFKKANLSNLFTVLTKIAYELDKPVVQKEKKEIIQVEKMPTGSKVGKPVVQIESLPTGSKVGKEMVSPTLRLPKGKPLTQELAQVAGRKSQK